MPWSITSIVSELRRAAVIVLCLICIAQNCGAEISLGRERDELVAFFSGRFPGVPLDDYVYGALIANPGGKQQYEQIMEFPPFLGDIEQGRRIWETPFRNGKSF